MNIVHRPTIHPRPTIRGVFDPLRAMRDLLSLEPCGEMERAAGASGFRIDPVFEEAETPEGYRLRAELQGLKEGDLEISVSGDQLTIWGHRETDRREEGDRHYVYEHSYASFGRTFTLPERYDGSMLVASLDDGVLTLLVPARRDAWEGGDGARGTSGA